MPEKKQIFCFTFAGGNAGFFDSVKEDLPDFDVIALEYSGHGTRHREPLYTDFEELAEDMLGLLRARYQGEEYALFGYSMGTISLMEVLKKIQCSTDIPLPAHVFLAAHEPGTRAFLTGMNEDEINTWVKDRTIRFGTVPEKLLNNKSFWRIYLPLYRADYLILGQYRFENLNLATEIPATVFYSETDTPFEKIERWREYFTGSCEFYPFKGTHFFIQQHHNAMASIIRRRFCGGEIT